MALTQNEIDLVNQSLGRIGSKANLTTVNQTTANEGIKAELFFDETRDALLRSFDWNFARLRFKLSSVWKTNTSYVAGQFVFYPDASSTSLLYKCATPHTSGVFATDLGTAKWVIYTARPLFEYAYQYDLPTGLLRFLSADKERQFYVVEDNLLVTDEYLVDIRYTDQVTDPTDWDALFIEVFVLKLGLKLLPAIGGVSTTSLTAEVNAELKDALARARSVCGSENRTTGKSKWNLARYTSGLFRAGRIR